MLICNFLKLSFDLLREIHTTTQNIIEHIQRVRQNNQCSTKLIMGLVLNSAISCVEFHLTSQKSEFFKQINKSALVDSEFKNRIMSKFHISQNNIIYDLCHICWLYLLNSALYAAKVNNRGHILFVHIIIWWPMYNPILTKNDHMLFLLIPMQ